MNTKKIIILIINYILTLFFAGGYYPAVGVVLCIASVMFSLLDKGTVIGEYIVLSQIRSWNPGDLVEAKDKRPVLLSISFLTLSMKIGAAIAVFVEVSAVLLLAFCILIASGYLFEGRKSGMSIGGAWAISKLVVKVYLFFTSLVDKLADLIVKIEFALLKVEAED